MHAHRTPRHACMPSAAAHRPGPPLRLCLCLSWVSRWCWWAGASRQQRARRRCQRRAGQLQPRRSQVTRLTIAMHTHARHLLPVCTAAHGRGLSAGRPCVDACAWLACLLQAPPALALIGHDRHRRRGTGGATAGAAGTLRAWPSPGDAAAQVRPVPAPSRPAGPSCPPTQLTHHPSEPSAARPHTHTHTYIYIYIYIYILYVHALPYVHAYSCILAVYVSARGV
jgi:hypothetical protein